MINSDLAVEFASDCVVEQPCEKKVSPLVKRVELTDKSVFSDRCGIYYDILVGGNMAEVENSVAKCILEYKYNREKLLFVGLGNAKYISDALGELVLDNLPEPHKKMAKFKPQVSKLTGIQSHDLIIAAKKIIKPTLIIAIDSLATSDISKVGKSIQITNVGLAPASGLGIARQVLTAKSLGVPILAIGVPLVANVNIKGSNRLVIPIDIEDIAQNLAKAIANGITQILN